ncbi:MAG: hypothetical protein ACFCUR_11560 [Rhodomicrobiaceae bacterium]
MLRSKKSWRDGLAGTVVAKKLGSAGNAPAHSFPILPKVDLVLYQAGRRHNPAADAMADLITNHFAR